MKVTLFFFVFLLSLSAQGATTDNPTVTSSVVGATASLSPTPESVNRNSHSSGAAKALVVHKPMPSPSWGKVIQYHRQENFVLSDKNREILHEFLFQDDAGIIRTAIYHEPASGDGYWEIWVWD